MEILLVPEGCLEPPVVFKGPRGPTGPNLKIVGLLQPIRKFETYYMLPFHHCDPVHRLIKTNIKAVDKTIETINVKVKFVAGQHTIIYNN